VVWFDSSSDTALSLTAIRVSPPVADNCNTDLLDTLADAGAGVKSSSVDGQSAEEHPLKDQIELAKLRAANGTDEHGRRRRGFKLIKVIPPGAV
jgi:hypothetical protein